jgi:hypothetical protein
MTQIEDAFFIDTRVHAVSAFALSVDEIVMTIHPCQNPSISSRARFSGLRSLSVEIGYDDGDIMLPWDIIGFDSYELADGYWRFVLNCGSSHEFIFESLWPEITKPL